MNWELPESWLTPQNHVFSVQNYGVPEIDDAEYQFKIAGLLNQPMQPGIDKIKSRPRSEVVMTLKCAGNGSSLGFRSIPQVYALKWAEEP